MSEYGSEVIRYRQKFIEDLNEIIKEIHKNLTEKRKIVLKYDYSVNYDEFLTVYREREIDLKICFHRAGPHRDDIEFFGKMELDIHKFGSQGAAEDSSPFIETCSRLELVKDRPERH